MLNRTELFAVNLPRYTSYPTAPHFHSGIDEWTYRDWLRDLPSEPQLSLYVHIPFCDTLCWFCGCHTSAVSNYHPVREYMELLLQEMVLLEKALPRRHRVVNIHWGGGSPTILSPADIGKLNIAIRSHFDVLPEAEFAVEIDPRGFTLDTVKAMARGGLTRASIGLQDCNPLVQHAINRVQTNSETIQAIKMLRSEGVNHINLDLVYGLPHQTAGSWRETLDFAVELMPDRLAVFGYAHVPHFKKHQALIPQDALPGIAERLELSDLAREVLCRSGYLPIGLDHFAKSGDDLAIAARAGTLRRNFQGYTTDQAPVLLGLGASSIGSLPEGYVQNIPKVPLYRAFIEKARLPIVRGIGLSEDDKIRRQIIERLMCGAKVDLETIASQWHRDVSMFAGCLDRLSPLIDEGLVDRAGMQIKVAKEWPAAARLAAAAFDAYLTKGIRTHSLAV